MCNLFALSLTLVQYSLVISYRYWSTNMSFLITSITLLVLFSDSKCCKPGWLEFEDKCYWFSNSNLDWYRASSCCQALSSKLAEPLTTDAMNFMSSETITKDVVVSAISIKTHHRLCNKSTPNGT
ncbi:asialoglycoprotein receptor 2-like [Ostrea edulis]|uniref:asialoglycoprotein receptor 2-like n=1 Tax=Ostrea edulis TaxID=37623 RepID=UPI0024AF04E9|nr:asialoglycoprotein receptor 2-like [Ostrea edulis]